MAIKYRAFLNGVQENMVRTFALDSYSGVGPFARMVFDAFPGGAGGLLVVDGKVVFWFATKSDEVNEKAVGIQSSNSDSQQVADVRECVLERDNDGF